MSEDIIILPVYHIFEANTIFFKKISVINMAMKNWTASKCFDSNVISTKPIYSNWLVIWVKVKQKQLKNKIF